MFLLDPMRLIKYDREAVDPFPTRPESSIRQESESRIEWDGAEAA
jgi:hypothetical protein